MRIFALKFACRAFAVSMLALLYFAPGTSAATTNFSQKILPMDCVFQVIDVGTQTLRYLTPKQCGVLIPPPKAQGSTHSQHGQSTALFHRYTSHGNSLFLSETPSNTNIATQLPWNPIVSIEGNSNPAASSQSNVFSNAVATITVPTKHFHATKKTIVVAATGVTVAAALLLLLIVLL